MDPSSLPEPESESEPPQLRFLRRLVTVLTATMIAGMVIIVVLMVMRFNAPVPVLPDRIALPDGAEPTAFTQGPDWFAVVTEDNRILIYDRATGTLRQTVRIDLERP